MSAQTKKLWRDDDALFVLAQRELFTAVVGDIMDQLGAQRQFLPPRIRPLRDDMVVVGRAMTVLESDYDDSQNRQRKKPDDAQPFGLMLEALDDLKRNEVYLCAGASPAYALWGELMSVRARRCGAVGAIMDGFSRDTRAILALGFPTFSFGPYAQDQAPRGCVVDFRTRLRIGEVTVTPGDIVFGDLDGVCVVPRALEAEVFTKALEKARGEKTVRRAIERGMTARAAFKKYGIM